MKKALCLTFVLLCIAAGQLGYAEGLRPYNLSSYSNNSEFTDYMNNINDKIQKVWNPPDFMLSAHALLAFRVLRNGEISDIRVVESSGNELFDESAKEALRKSAPFMSFPKNTEKEALTIRYSFDTSLVSTDRMKQYLEHADRLYNVDNSAALDYINLAIDEVRGDLSSYFLYGKRSKIKNALGDIEGANADLEECKRLKVKHDRRRICMCKLNAENEQSPFAYFYLATAYEMANDYQNAILAIDKAISMTELNNQYKRYKEELIKKSQL